MVDLRHPFIPTLDGEPLESDTDAAGRLRFTKKDGTQIATEREEDVVFVNTSLDKHWWEVSGLSGLEGVCFDDEAMSDIEVSGEVIDRSDVENLLKAIAADHQLPEAKTGDMALDPAFFHRALMAFIDGEHDIHVPLPFSFWKAEVQEVEGDGDGAPEGAQVFFATVYGDANDEPQSTQYWVKNRTGGWIGAPLVFQDDPKGDAGRVKTQPVDFAALFDNG